MEGSSQGGGPGRPLDPRDWEATRGAEQQTEHLQPTQPGQAAPPAQPAQPVRHDEDVPENIRDQTRDGEEPYQWHSGRTREHGAG